jgi:hypothetical protein
MIRIRFPRINWRELIPDGIAYLIGIAIGIFILLIGRLLFEALNP